MGPDDLLATSRDFKARLTWAELHCVRLLRSQEDLPRIAYVSLEPALVFVTFPTTVDPRRRFPRMSHGRLLPG